MKTNTLRMLFNDSESTWNDSYGVRWERKDQVEKRILLVGLTWSVGSFSIHEGPEAALGANTPAHLWVREAVVWWRAASGFPHAISSLWKSIQK